MFAASSGRNSAYDSYYIRIAYNIYLYNMAYPYYFFSRNIYFLIKRDPKKIIPRINIQIQNFKEVQKCTR